MKLAWGNSSKSVQVMLTLGREAATQFWGQ